MNYKKAQLKVEAIMFSLVYLLLHRLLALENPFRLQNQGNYQLHVQDFLSEQRPCFQFMQDFFSQNE